MAPDEVIVYVCVVLSPYSEGNKNLKNKTKVKRRVKLCTTQLRQVKLRYQGLRKCKAPTVTYLVPNQCSYGVTLATAMCIYIPVHIHESLPRGVEDPPLLYLYLSVESILVERESSPCPEVQLPLPLLSCECVLVGRMVPFTQTRDSC